MVTYSRTSLGASAGHVRPLVSGASAGVVSQRAQLRPLNAPMPLRVQLDSDGRVVSIWRQGRLTPRTIAAIQDRWRIDDEWWREHPVSRMYYEVVLDDGTLLTLYQDLIADAWFEQRT
jgi:hypothetical protein